MNRKKNNNSISAADSMDYIESLLAKIGATEINRKFEEKVCTGITFKITDNISQKAFTYFLKAQVDEYFLLHWNEKKHRLASADSLYNEARNNAWKILADWTAMQYNMVVTSQGQPLQLFFSFLV